MSEHIIIANYSIDIIFNVQIILKMLHLLALQ